MTDTFCIMTAMTKTRQVRPGMRGATLSTLHEIERILREAHSPLSLNEIKRRMSAKAVRHGTVRMAVDEFIRLGFVVSGRNGVIWVFEPSPQSIQHNSRKSIPDVDELAGSLSKFGPVGEWKKELDRMRGEEE